jgi:hypothetical protein
VKVKDSDVVLRVAAIASLSKDVVILVGTADMPTENIIKLGI